MRLTLPLRLHHLLPAFALSPAAAVASPSIVSTAPRTEGKCSFVGHAAKVTSIQEALNALNEILALKKVSKASHNILAYRIAPGTSDSTAPSSPSQLSSAPLAGFDNDGESPAGARLLRMLEMREENDVLVVVSRWYGGSPLGNKRFRAIDAVSLVVAASQRFADPPQRAGREALDLLKQLDGAKGAAVAVEAAKKQRKGKRRRSG